MRDGESGARFFSSVGTVVAASVVVVLAGREATAVSCSCSVSAVAATLFDDDEDVDGVEVAAEERMSAASCILCSWMRVNVHGSIHELTDRLTHGLMHGSTRGYHNVCQCKGG